MASRSVTPRAVRELGGAQKGNGSRRDAFSGAIWMAPTLRVMTEKPKAPPPEETPKSVKLVETTAAGTREFSERGLQVVAVTVTPASERPTGGVAIPPPTSAAHAGGDAPAEPASQEPSQPSE